MFRMVTPDCVRPAANAASLLLSLIVLAACGTDGGDLTPRLDVGADVADSSADAGDDATADTGPVLTACEDNTDCAGGEVCREGFCRQSCASSDDCTGELPACDTALGYCVGCVTDDDCGDNAVCEDAACTFFCETDLACAADEFCDVPTGVCLDRECASAADCSGGFTCDDYRCVPIDDIICTPDAARCSDDGGAVFTCNGDGTVEAESACGTEQVCIDGDGGAACLDVVCTPNDLGCLDDATAFLCDATGTEQAELPCAGGQYCEAGACRDQVCAPDTITCDGNAVVTCDGRGASATVEVCADTADCAGSDFGCTCVDGACETRTCTPGTARCAGNSVQACAEDGLGYDAPEACDASEICVAGACVTRECTAGTRECAGDTLVVCNEDGTRRDETSCAAAGELCTGSAATAACTARVCTPDAIACDATGTAVVTCDARGSAESTTACPAGTYCTGGACLDQVCAPGSGDVCVDGDVQRCNARGSGYLLVDDCDAETQRCRAGACLDLACEAGATRCSGDTLLECSLDGLTETPTVCRDLDSYCSSDTLACEPWVCVPGVSTCDGDDVVTCDARGSASGVTETCSATLGCAGGACVEGCGDGVVQEGEACDDGNVVDGDGCDSGCASEVPDGFVRIEAGTFTMGSPPGELGRDSDETQHEVTLTRDFFMQATEVTQAQWQSLMGNNPSYFDSCGSDCPVELVNWWDAAGYANALSASEGLDECYTLEGCDADFGEVPNCTGVTVNAPGGDVYACEGYRLPTEAEWEYAARGGTTTATYNGDLTETSCGFDAVLDPIGWYCGNDPGGTSPVRGKTPNAYGLYDMLGNVWEWCWDRYESYPGDVTDPSGPLSGSFRVLGGGSWGSDAQLARAAGRFNRGPGFRNRDIGFRLVRTEQ